MDVAEKSQQSKSSFIMHLVQKSFGIWHAKRALVLLLLPFLELASHTICHTFFLFPILPSFSRSSHLQIMKAIMLLLRQTPFYDYEFLVVAGAGTKYSLHLCMQTVRPHKIWANAFNKLSQDNAWKVPRKPKYCALSLVFCWKAATKYAKKSGEIGVLLDIMSLSAVFFNRTYFASPRLQK